MTWKRSWSVERNTLGEEEFCRLACFGFFLAFFLLFSFSFLLNVFNTNLCTLTSQYTPHTHGNCQFHDNLKSLVSVMLLFVFYIQLPALRSQNACLSLSKSLAHLRRQKPADEALTQLPQSYKCDTTFGISIGFASVEFACDENTTY